MVLVVRSYSDKHKHARGKFHHLTYLKEALFARQLILIVLPLHTRTYLSIGLQRGHFLDGLNKASNLSY